MNKKVLHITHSLQTGGLERLIINLTNAIDTKGFEPYICCIASPGELAAEFNRHDNLLVINHKGRVGLTGWLSVYRILKKYNFDVIHTHNLAGLLYGVPAAKLARIPVIHTNHGYVEKEKRNIKLKLIEGLLSRLVDCYVCVSDRLLNDVEKRLHVSSKKILVIYNGVITPGRFNPVARYDKNIITIGSVGSLIPIKNYRFLLEAFSEIAVKRQTCKLELVGDGNQRSELERLRDSLNLQEKVTFRGKVTNPEDYVSAFDVFVMVSLSEGLSLAILEAMSHRKICVVSDVGGNSEIIRDGENGFMFESNDRESFLSVMEKVLDGLYTPEMEAVREAAGRTVRNRFSLDITLEKYRECYEAVTS